MQPDPQQAICKSYIFLLLLKIYLKKVNLQGNMPV
jgi:hypothetical protein